MAKYLKNHLNLNEIDFFIPVPLHPEKQKERGFNQAELLALELTWLFDIPTVSGLLFRTKETRHQFDLPKAERFRNVKGAFEVKGAGFLSGKNVLLIDDIYTTGSTIAECTRVLKEAGARKIHVLTLSCALEG
jgi:ComF family protein